MAGDNIIHLPSLLERLADELRYTLGRAATNREEWVEIQEGLCLTLAEARGQFAADIEFGQWCANNGFGEDVLNHQTRAAAIAMGQQPDALRKCLEATERRSLEKIYRFDFNGFTHMRKPASRRQAKLEQKRSPQFAKAKEAIEQLRAEGKPVTHKAVRERAGGISDTPVRIALAEARAEADLSFLTPGEMTKAMAKRYEFAIRKARAEIREELKEEVYRELDIFVKPIKERSERADRILSGYQGVMTKETFRKIRACLHPDHNTFAFATEALQAFSELEQVLVKPDDPVYSGPPLPATAAELMALRRK